MYDFDKCKGDLYNYLLKNCSTNREIINMIYGFAADNLFIDYIKDHSLAYYNLSRRRQTYELKKHEVLFTLTKEINKALTAENIKGVYLKGLPLEKDLYPDGNIRYIEDIDILIRHKDIIRFISILNQLGYTSPDDSPYTEEAIIADDGDHHMLPAKKTFESDGDIYSVCIEPHIHFLKSYGSTRRRIARLTPLQLFNEDDITEKVINRSAPFDLYGCLVNTLDPIDNVIFNAEHFAHHYADSLFVSVCHNENPYGCASLRSVFETMLLFHKYINNENNEAQLYKTFSKLDGQSQWGFYLTFLCGNYISSNIIPNKAINKMKSELNDNNFCNIYTALLCAAEQNIAKILSFNLNFRNEIINCALNIYNSAHKAESQPMLFSNRNCIVRVFNSTTKLPISSDIGELSTELTISRTKDGLKIRAIYNDNTYQEFDEDLMRLELNLVFCGREIIQNRICSIILVSNKSSIFALINNKHYLQLSNNFQYNILPFGFSVIFTITWEQLGIIECIPSKGYVAATMIHIDGNGTADYMLVPSAVTYDINNYIEFIH